MDLFGRKKATKVEVDELRQRLIHLGRTAGPHATPRTPPAPPVGTSLDDIRQTAEQAGRDVSSMLQALAALRARQDLLDRRVEEIASAFTAQLGELSAEIDGLAARAVPPGTTDHAGTDTEAVGRLRDGQIRLANEQARYEMAMRADLAALADALRSAGKMPRLNG